MSKWSANLDFATIFFYNKLVREYIQEEQHVVSTYFDAIIGHTAIKERLIRTIRENRMPHAVIFSGPAGVGKTMMACAAASLLIGRTVFLDLSSREEALLWADRDDAFYIAPVGTMLKVDQFRQLQERLVLQGQQERYRVAIIDHAETMNTEFANRMLKILEEPPAGVCFILITSQPALLLPTIVSRCAVFSFEPVPSDDMLDGLVRLRGGDKEKYTKAVLQGNGIVKTVLDFLDGNGWDSIQYALDFLTIMAAHRCPYAKWLSLSGELTEQMSMDVFRWIMILFRDMVVLRSGAPDTYMQLPQYRQQMLKLQPYWNDAAIFKNLTAVETGMEAVRRRVNIRLIWDYISLECVKTKKGGN